MHVDINFNFYSDAGGGDPDSRSPTLRKYHKILWSKPLPNGTVFELTDTEKGAYLYHNSVLGEFVLGSDAIVHSYRNQKRKQWLTTKIPEDVNELFSSCCNIASYIIFPKNAVDGGQTINQSRGVNKFIDDRFDLTLECIRRLYLNQSSPLYSVLVRYKSFFDLFKDFNGYIDFFFLQDLVDIQSSRVKFYLPFDDFKNPPVFLNTDDYISYKNGVMNFNSNRKSRIEEYVKTYLR